jgi:GT2 family glycosyltransferase
LRFTAIVVTWNSADEIGGLVESIRRHLPESCRLLFVDNNSEDETVATIRAAAPEAEVIALGRNVGFGPANNAGVRAATTDVVALLNPDTVVIDDSLAALGALAASEHALFAPRLLNEDGSAQIAARPPLAGWESALTAVWPGALMPRRIRKRCEPWRYEERLPAGWLSGACLVARRELLLALGPFDERLPLYGEDADLCVRAWQAGIPCVSAGDVARIVHLGGRSGAQAFDDVGMQRKIEARWWVVNERLGPARGAYDLAMQALVHASRWLAKRLLRRDAEVQAVWLRAAARAVRSRRPPLPAPLRD